VPYLSASEVVIHYEEVLYQVYAPFTFTTITATILQSTTTTTTYADERVGVQVLQFHQTFLLVLVFSLLFTVLLIVCCICNGCAAFWRNIE